MTSLIFGSIYLAHKGATGAYREKQRRKNYERWEGLRDEYDAQKRITRETRSLDIQRTGTGEFGHDDRPIVSLRDLQEANDARTGWRPQESWEHSAAQPSQSQPQLDNHHERSQSLHRPQVDEDHRSISAPSVYWQGRGQLRPQKTGATWDEGLPERLRVSRRNFDDQGFNPHRLSRSHSVQADSMTQRSNSVQSSRTSSRTRMFETVPAPVSSEPVAMDPQFFQQLTATTANTIATATPVVPTPVYVEQVSMSPYFVDTFKTPVAATYAVHPGGNGPIESHVPGGRMAELIERGY